MLSRFWAFIDGRSDGSGDGKRTYTSPRQLEIETIDNSNKTHMERSTNFAIIAADRRLIITYNDIDSEGNGRAEG